MDEQRQPSLASSSRLREIQGVSELFLIPKTITRYASVLFLLTLLLLTACGTTYTAGPSSPSSSSTGSPAPAGPDAAHLVIQGASTVRLQGGTKYTVVSSGLATSNVTWSLGSVSGNASLALGTIQADGTYTAPALPSKPTLIAIKATSVDDPDVSSTMQIQLLNPVPEINTASFIIQPTASNYQIFIAGNGFAPSASVTVNGVVLAATGVTPSSIFLDVPVTQLPPGTQTGAMASLVVANPSPGPSTSNNYDVQIAGPSTSVTAASRLLDQMTFGPTADSIAHVQQVGLSAAIDEQLAIAPELMPQVSWFYGALSPSCMPFQQCVTDGYWAQYAIFGQDQLKQRVAYALSNIWNVSYFGAPIPEFSHLLNVFAADSTANYRTLMQDVTLTEAMGTYLNMLNSSVPASGQHANENYARELMQLFTLGPMKLNDDGSPLLDAEGREVPTYTQAQVEAFASAYTGWTYANDDCSAPSGFQIVYQGAIPGLACPMQPVEALHDKAAKALLDGVVLPAGQTARQDLNQALDNIFNDPNLPPFVSKLLIQNLVTSSPSPEYVRRIAGIFENDGRGQRGNLAAVIKAILLDVEARQGDDPTRTITGGHLRDPILWSFAVMRALDATQLGDESAMNQLISMAGYMGEQPHSQPSVFGFYSPQFKIPGTELNAPEFQLEGPSEYVNMSIALDDHMLRPFFAPSNSGADVALNLTASSRLGILATQGADPLLGGLNTLFFHGRMTAAERQVLKSALASTTTPTDMLKVALYDTLMSPQFRIIQ